jgi:hypothetical protein
MASHLYGSIWSNEYNKGKMKTDKIMNEAVKEER